MLYTETTDCDWNRFPVGQRVRVTREAEIAWRLRAWKTGTVVGYGREGQTVRVIPDGCSAAQTFYHGFFEPVKE